MMLDRSLFFFMKPCWAVATVCFKMLFSLSFFSSELSLLVRVQTPELYGHERIYNSHVTDSNLGEPTTSAGINSIKPSPYSYFTFVE
jgi:hypothetical protein